MANTKRKIFNILVSATAATIVCQLGMALTCINAASVMRMPTLKNTIIVFAVAISATVGIDFFINNIINYTRKTATGIAILVLFLFMSVASALLKPIMSAEGDAAYRYPMLAAIGGSVLFCQMLFHKVKPTVNFKLLLPDFTRPENVFITIAIVFGTVICIVLPQKTMTCIDDETHYKDTLVFSEGIYTAYNEDDTDLIYGWDESKNAEEHVGKVFVDANPLGFLPNKIGYLAPTLGVWIGRILSLKINGVYLCGRLSGLIFYAVVVYFAIKRLVNGKIVLGVICLSPIAIQYAVGYSYDAWLMAFTSLSFAYYFGARQCPDEYLTSKDIIIMIGAMFIGTWPKMPYAVLFLLLLFMPKSKFADSGQRKKYYFCIITCIAFEVIFTFATSFGLGDVADTRGGENVSAYGQMVYIINNPKEFVGTLMRWLKNYLTPFNSWDYLTRFGFYQNTGMYKVLAIAIALFTVLDNETHIHDGKTRILGLTVLFMLVIVIGVLMYLSYTPVGGDTFQGVQTRYKLQLLFPFVMLLLSGYIVPKQKYRKFLTYMAYTITSLCLVMTIVSII